MTWGVKLRLILVLKSKGCYDCKIVMFLFLSLLMMGVC